MSAEDRDRQFEQALARHLRSDARGARDSGCLDAETLAAYHEKSLAPEEMSAATAHLEHCPHCSETLGLLAAMEVATGDAEPVSTITQDAKRVELSQNPSAKVTAFPRKKSVPRWVAPAAAVAAALVLWIGAREYRSSQTAKTYIAENREEAAPKISPPAAQEQAPPPAGPQRQRDKALDKEQRDDFALQEKSKQFAPPPSPPALHEQPRTSPSENQSPALESPYVARSALARPSPRKKVFAGKVEAGAPQQANGAATSDKTEMPTSRNETVEVTAAAPLVTSADTGAKLKKDQAEAGDLNRFQAGAGTGALGGAAGAQAAKAASPPPPRPAPAAKPAYSGDKTIASNAPSSTSQSVVVSEAEVTGQSMQSLLPANLSTLPVRVASPDGTHLWRFGQSGLVAYSSNAGGTWVAQPSGVTQSLTSGSAPSDRVCWIAGAAGTLIRTGDGGKHWKVIVTPISGDLGGVLATDKSHATIWDGPNQVRFVTTDGGATWKPATNP